MKEQTSTLAKSWVIPRWPKPPITGVSMWLRNYYFVAPISTLSRTMAPPSTLRLPGKTPKRQTYLSIEEARPPLRSAPAVSVGVPPFRREGALSNHDNEAFTNRNLQGPASLPDWQHRFSRQGYAEHAAAPLSQRRPSLCHGA